MRNQSMSLEAVMKRSPVDPDERKRKSNSNQINNTSGYRGVCWHKVGRKWMAFIKVDGLQIHLGMHKNIIDAAKAYDRAAKIYHRDLAILNFPEEGI